MQHLRFTIVTFPFISLVFRVFSTELQAFSETERAKIAQPKKAGQCVHFM